MGICLLYHLAPVVSSRAVVQPEAKGLPVRERLLQFQPPLALEAARTAMAAAVRQAAAGADPAAQSATTAAAPEGSRSQRPVEQLEAPGSEASLF